MRPFVSYIWFSCLLFIYQPLHSQQLLFENYSSEQGLSQHFGLSIAQDGDGFMWFGTGEGLNRYDGRKFKIFTRLNEAGKKLPSNVILSLSFDSVNNLLWIGTPGGACLYVPSGDSIAALSSFFPFASSLDKLSVKKIVSFSPNEYWVITYNSGLIYLNTKSAALYSFFTSDEDKTNVTDVVWHDGKIIVSLLYNLYTLLPTRTTYRAAQLHVGYQFPQITSLASTAGRLWVGTISRGCYYVKNPVEKKENIAASDIVFGGIQSFGTGNSKELWIATRGSGIHIYDEQTGSTTRAVHNQYDPATPASNIGLCIFKDRQGITWCGTSNGFSKYDPLRYPFSNLDGATSLNGSLTDKTVNRIYTCRDGSRYIGTLNRGIFEWNETNNEFKHFPASAIVDNANNVIYDMTEDESGNLWAATCGGLMELNRKTGEVSYFREKEGTCKYNSMYALVKLKKADSLLIASDEGLRFFSLRDRQWTPVQGRPIKTTLTGGLPAYKWGKYFYEDENNTLWICMGGPGLVRYRYLQNEIETVEPVNKLSSSINYLLPDGQNFLLATGNGIIVYDRVNNRVVKQVDVKGNGFSNMCYAVQKDDNGCFWASTNFGLCKVNAQFELVQKYSTDNGLSFQEYYTASTMKDPGGMLYFGGMGGITYFNPRHLKENNFSPAPLITAINVNDMPLPLDKNSGLVDKLDLNHNQDFISIQFAVTNFSNEANNLFSYRLKGLSDNWSAVGTSNVASFTSLPPGNYTFELRSANSDGKWSDGVKTIAITLYPPWWQTWWFRVGVLLLLSGLIIYFVRKRIRAIRHEANLKQKIAETEMMALRAQINPHFIFNSLNSIREMILNHENKEASHYLSKFAHLMRITLDQSSQSFVSLQGTLDYLHRYIEMEQIRNGQFTYTIDVDETLDTGETVLPPMLIQPFIENAIWHGTAGNHRNININIEFKKQNNQLVCIVDDNGIGIKQSIQNKNGDTNGHHSVGIANIKNRIQLLNEKYNLQSSVTIEDKSKVSGNAESGTLITLRLPLEIAEE